MRQPVKIQQAERIALKYTEYAWNDIALAFNEIGHDTSPSEKERICRWVYNRKLAYIKGKQT